MSLQGAWHYLALAFGTSDVDIILDGVTVTTDSLAGTFTDSTSYVGKYALYHSSDNSLNYDGFIHSCVILDTQTTDLSAYYSNSSGTCGGNAPCWIDLSVAAPCDCNNYE